MKLAAACAFLLMCVPSSHAQTVQLSVSPRSGQLTVRVMDTSGRPLPGVVIYLRAALLEPRLDVLTHTGSGNGLAEIAGLPHGQYRLVISLLGFEVWDRAVHIFPNDDQTLEVTLVAGGNGCVVSSDHSPVAGAIRDLAGRPPGRAAVVSESGDTITLHPSFSNGTFGWCRPPSAFDEVSVVFEPVGRVVLKPSRAAILETSWNRSLDVRGVQEAARAALLARSSTIGRPSDGPVTMRGRVVDTAGGSLPGVSVWLVRLGDDNEYVGRVTADDTGTFRLVDVPPGLYRVAGILPGFTGGVAYWDSREPGPVLIMAASVPGDCISLRRSIDVFVQTKAGIPLTAARLVTVRTDGGREYFLLRDGKSQCFAPSTSDEVRVEIEGLGETRIKPAGVDPSSMSWDITVDWPASLAARLKRVR